MRAVASLAVPVAALAALVSVGAATAATPCDQQVLSDWYADGRVDRAYRLECYQVAVESLPSDLRDYTNAQEEIERALQSAVRSEPPAVTGRTATSSSSSALVPALAVAAGGLLAAGAVWFTWRTRRARRHGP